MNEHQRRQRRLELAEKFAREVATWPSKKLRACYAQPETVRQAEERERVNNERVKELLATCGIYDRTGCLRTVIECALASNPKVTAADIRAIWDEAADNAREQK